MKKIFKSPNNVLHNVRKILFAFYLLVVSVSLPVLCFVQVSYRGNKVNTKEQGNADNSSVKQNQMATEQKADRTISFR